MTQVRIAGQYYETVEQINAQISNLQIFIAQTCNTFAEEEIAELRKGILRLERKRK